VTDVELRGAVEAEPFVDVDGAVLGPADADVTAGAVVVGDAVVGALVAVDAVESLEQAAITSAALQTRTTNLER